MQGIPGNNRDNLYLKSDQVMTMTINQYIREGCMAHPLLRPLGHAAVLHDPPV